MQRWTSDQLVANVCVDISSLHSLVKTDHYSVILIILFTFQGIIQYIKINPQRNSNVFREFTNTYILQLSYQNVCVGYIFV